MNPVAVSCARERGVLSFSDGVLTLRDGSNRALRSHNVAAGEVLFAAIEPSRRGKCRLLLEILIPPRTDERGWESPPSSYWLYYLADGSDSMNLGEIVVAVESLVRPNASGHLRYRSELARSRRKTLAVGGVWIAAIVATLALAAMLGLLQLVPIIALPWVYRKAKSVWLHRTEATTAEYSGRKAKLHRVIRSANAASNPEFGLTPVEHESEEGSLSIAGDPGNLSLDTQADA